MAAELLDGVGSIVQFSVLGRCVAVAHALEHGDGGPVVAAAVRVAAHVYRLVVRRHHACRRVAPCQHLVLRGHAERPHREAKGPDLVDPPGCGFPAPHLQCRNQKKKKEKRKKQERQMIKKINNEFPKPLRRSLVPLLFSFFFNYFFLSFLSSSTTSRPWDP